MAGAFQLLPNGTLKTVLTIAFGLLAMVFCSLTPWAFSMYRALITAGSGR